MSTKKASSIKLRKQPYFEGDWFAVPLPNGEYGLGLVARANGEGGILGYFFEYRQKNIPTQNDTQGLRPEHAFLIRICGDLGLVNGEWPIICHSSEWKRADWPQPYFARIAQDESRALRVERSENNIYETISEVPISVEEARRLPANTISGHRALEVRLLKILS